MMLRSGIYFIFLLLFFFTSAQAQDTHMSQILFSGPEINPAMAGSNADVRAKLSYRNQWNSITDPYSTITASVDMKLKRKKVKRGGFFAAGLDFFNDQSGEVRVNNTTARLHLAYHLYINANQTIGMGIYGGYGQRSLQSADGKWGSQYNGLEYDPSLSSGESMSSRNMNYADAGAGLIYTYKKNERFMAGNDQKAFSAGVSMFHVNQPNYSLNSGNDPLFMRLNVFGKGLIGMGGKGFFLAPSMLLQLQGPAREFIGGTYFRYMLSDASRYTGFVEASAFSVGLFYRNKDAFVAKALMEWSNYAMGISYDLNTSDLSEVSDYRGGFEIFLRFKTPSPFSSTSKARI